jgi:hypothetical protein
LTSISDPSRRLAWLFRISDSLPLKQLPPVQRLPIG